MRENTPSNVTVYLAHGGYDQGAYLQVHDGRLDVTTVRSLGSGDRPYADVALLLVCRAAKGANRAGDSPANLGTAFLLAGATTVSLSASIIRNRPSPPQTRESTSVTRL